MRTADIVVAAIMIGLGVLVGIDSLGRGAGWAADGPQAGFFPFLMAVLVVGGSVVVLIRALRSRAEAAGPFVLPGGLRPMLTVLLPAIGMVLLTEVLGLYLAAIVYLVGYVRWVGRFRWHVVLLVGVVVPIAFWVLFDKVFLVPMPKGMFGERLGF